MATPGPLTPESLAQRTASISDAIARVSSAATAYAETSKKKLGADDAANSNSSKTTEAAAQGALEVEAKKLLAEVQGPAGAMYDLLGSVCRASALRCLLDMGVFAALPEDGTPMTADVLISRLPGGGDVEKALLVRLLRNVTAVGAGPVVEVAEEVYAQVGVSSGGGWRGALGCYV